MARAASPRGEVTCPYTCELCGQDGMSEGDMRSHMLLQHVQSSPACPFCDLGIHSFCSQLKKKYTTSINNLINAIHFKVSLFSYFR